MKKLAMFSFAVLGSMFSPHILAGEYGFVGSAGFQLKNLTMGQSVRYDWQSNAALNSTEKGELTALLPVLNIQGIAFYDDWYAVLKLETTIANQAVDSTIPDTTKDTSLQTEVSREDYSISIGYKVTSGLTVFGGYMFGKTELTPQHSPCVDNICVNAASNMYDQNFGQLRHEYKEDGLFGGVSYGWNLSQGNLSASIGYAFMDGVYHSNKEFAISSAHDIEFKYEGESTGYSTALSWVAPITNNLVYFVDARYQQYSMNADEIVLSDLVFINAKTEETIFGLSGGVQMVF